MSLKAQNDHNFFIWGGMASLANPGYAYGTYVMLGTIDLFPLQLSCPSYLNITFFPASHHFWPQQITSLAASQNMAQTCAFFI